jgi:hypothetical protein
MPSFSTEVPHTLGQEQATERLKHFVEKVRERYQDQVKDLDGEWTENTLNVAFKTYGFAIKATLDVHEDAVKLNGELPIAAVVFRGKIEQSIAGELKRVLT